MSAAVSLPTFDREVLIVRGYAIACCEAARMARDELSAKVDRLVVSREEADAALERCRQACELAERMSTFAARAMAGDVEPSTLTELAAACSELMR